jgi:hypothetical protein
MVDIPSIVTLVVELLVGGLALAVSVRYVATGVPEHKRRLGYGVVTALLGALVWAVLGLVPLLGTVLALVGYLLVIKLRYPVGWLRAGLVAVVAWVVAVVVVAALGLVGVDVSAFGVPGV